MFSFVCGVVGLVVLRYWDGVVVDVLRVVVVIRVRWCSLVISLSDVLDY